MKNIEKNKRKKKFCPYCGKKTVHFKETIKVMDKSKIVWRCENCYSFN